MLILSSSEIELASGDWSAMEIDTWDLDKVTEDGIININSVNSIVSSLKMGCKINVHLLNCIFHMFLW